MRIRKMKEKHSITVEEKLWEDFKTKCFNNGMKMSTRIAKLIEDDLEWKSL
jgi:pterin-4a-carbinolamine dehydratase